MVNHLTGHATVDADVLACDETSLVGTKVQHHIGDVQRITNTSGWLLDGIGAFIDPIARINPSWGDGVDTHFPCKADGQRMSQGCDASLGC